MREHFWPTADILLLATLDAGLAAIPKLMRLAGENGESIMFPLSQMTELPLPHSQDSHSNDPRQTDQFMMRCSPEQPHYWRRDGCWRCRSWDSGGVLSGSGFTRVGVTQIGTRGSKWGWWIGGRKGAKWSMKFLELRSTWVDLACWPELAFWSADNRGGS